MVDDSDAKITPDFGVKGEYMPFDVLNFCAFCNAYNTNKSQGIETGNLRTAALDSAKIYLDPEVKNQMILDLAGVKSAEELKGKPPQAYNKAQRVFEETLSAVDDFITFCNNECAYRSV